MKILFVTANAEPLFTTPALATTAARLPALAAELHRAGHEVSVVAPLGSGLAETLKVKATGVKLALVPGGGGGGGSPAHADVLEARSPGGLQTFLIRREEFLGHTADTDADAALPATTTVVGGEGGEPAAGFLFARFAVELARRLAPAPDVVQAADDWPGALALVLLRAARLPFGTVLTLGAKNLSSQGSFPVESFARLNLGWEWFTPATLEFFGRINCLKGAITQADALVADGEGDRRALQTAAFGAGLDGVLREHAGRLHGIADGLDEAAWNPATDKLLPRKYRPTALGGKRTSANVTLAALGLNKNPAGPVYLLEMPPPDGANANAPASESLGLLAPALDQILADDVRLLVLNAGPVSAARTEPARHLEIAAKRYPAQVAILRADRMDERAAHGALAAADFKLCLDPAPGSGAGVLRALRYGVVPVFPAGRGLEAMAEDYQPADEAEREGGQGLVFRELTTRGLLDALYGRARPLVTGQPARWEALRRRAMLHAGKFTWSRTAADYAGLYARLRAR